MNKVFLSYIILRVLVVIVMMKQFTIHNYEYVFLCILVLILFFLPNIIEKNTKVRLPDTLEIIILLFIFASEILGEIQCFYITIPGWDSILHILSGFLCAAIGLSLVEILNKSQRVALSLSPFFVVVVAFCFSMTVGVFWEFVECGIDLVFGLDMQKDTIITSIHSVALDPTGGNTPYIIEEIEETMVNGQKLAIDGYLDIGLLDTMKDLFVNFVGALVFSVAGYFSLAKGGRGRWLKNLLPRKISKDR